MQDWTNILRKKVVDNGVNIIGSLDDRVETAIKRATAWLIEQAVAKPDAANLCLEYISEHIARRAMVKLGYQGPEVEVLFSQTVQLADRLEMQGIDISQISKNILEDIAGKKDPPLKKPLRSWTKYTKTKKEGRYLC